MLGFLKSFFAGFAPLKPAGPPKQIAVIIPGSTLISDNATWVDQAIVVNVDAQNTVRIFELPLKSVEQCKLVLKFQMSSSDVLSGAFPEMWVKVEGFGEAFSKGLNYRLKGNNNWTTCELPFFLKKGQPATSLKLNVVFAGAGSILLKEIELYSTLLE